jgi:hypothetical protein
VDARSRLACTAGSSRIRRSSRPCSTSSRSRRSGRRWWGTRRRTTSRRRAPGCGVPRRPGGRLPRRAETASRLSRYRPRSLAAI